MDFKDQSDLMNQSEEVGLKIIDLFEEKCGGALDVDFCSITLLTLLATLNEDVNQKHADHFYELSKKILVGTFKS